MKQNQDKSLFKKTMCITFALGILAYGFAAFGFMPYHDSLWCVYQVSPTHNEFASQLAFGRFLQPVYAIATGAVSTTPTTAIALAICWISIAVFLICKMLDTTRTTEIVLMAAVCLANKTVLSLVATFLPWVSADTFAFLLSVIAVYLWRTSTRGQAAPLVISALCIAASLSLYQSFICTYIVLVFLISIKDLVDRESTREVFSRGLRAVLALVIGCCIYLALLIIVPIATNTELAQGGYNNITNISSNDESWGRRLYQTLREIFIAFFSAENIPSVWDPRLIVATNIIVTIATLTLFVILSIKRRLSPQAFVTIIIFALCSVFFANLVRLINQTTHDLMHYAFWLLYLIPILFLSAFSDDKDASPSSQNTAQYRLTLTASSFIAVACVIIIMFNNIQVSNIVLLDRTIRYNATQSLATEILTRVDELPGYTEGETKVAFVGNLDGQLLPPASVTTSSSLTGQKQTGEAYTGYRYLQIMINDLMLRKTSILSESQASRLGKTDKVMTLPTWPNPGSVQLIDGVVVVKFS